MKKMKIFVWIFILFITACQSQSNDSQRNSSKRKTDSIDYKITNNFKPYFKIILPKGDTVTSYVREIIVENNFTHSVYLPIFHLVSYTDPTPDILLLDKSLDNRTIIGCKTQKYTFGKDSMHYSGWAAQCCFDKSAWFYKLKSNTKETFYIHHADRRNVKEHEDSFIFSFKYFFDTIKLDDHYITKRLYTKGENLIEIEKFYSLEH